MHPPDMTAVYSSYLIILVPYCDTAVAGVLVGLEETLYTTSESDEVVEVCVMATGTDPHCPYNIPFEVLLITVEISAGELSLTMDV